MLNKNEILAYYTELCTVTGKMLTRTEYREMSPVYSSNLIEKIWGSWTAFSQAAENNLTICRKDNTKVFDKKVDKIVLTYIHDGLDIDLDVFNILKTYCRYNKAELGILWGRGLCKNSTLDINTYNLLKEYLATKFEFARDPDCIAQDFLIPCTQKNPLLRLDQISTSLRTIIAGSAKQYLKIFPYKEYDKYRIGASTGTISKIDYKTTSSGFIDKKYHTFGGILLEWSKEEKRYIIRNLVCKDGQLYDMNFQYTPTTRYKLSNVPAMILGDLHFPEQAKEAMSKTHTHLKLLHPKEVAAGDWCSYNSINHHTASQALTKLKNITEKDATLEIELRNAIDSLNSLTKDYPNTQFKIIYSNHDKFVTSFLNDGLFVKDTNNAVIGCELFMKLAKNQPLFNDFVNSNITFLAENDEFEVSGVDLSNHGHIGIAGSRGNPKTYTKICEKAVVGHTHSPELNGNIVVVGTNSQLKLNYTSNISNWAFGNAIVHENGTIQLLLA